MPETSFQPPQFLITEHLYLYVMVTQVPLVCIIQQLTGVFVVYGCIIFYVVYKNNDETVLNEMLLI